MKLDIMNEELYPGYDEEEDENPEYREKLYTICSNQASDVGIEFQPSETDTIDDLLEKYFNWGFKYNQTYFPDLDCPKEKQNNFIRWLSSKWGKYVRIAFPDDDILRGMNPDEAKAVYEEYIDEMIAEGAWCGHSYPQEYLHDIYFKVRDLLKKKLDYYGSRAEKEHRELIDQVMEMERDLDDLTDKIYGCDQLSSDERDYIGELIAAKFKRTLENGIKLLGRYYKEHTGERIDR